MYDVIHNRFKILERFLQQEVMFNIEHKTVRKGKLLLYNLDNYHVKFTILTNKNLTKNYEIPYPFKLIENDNNIRFSYRIDDLCRDNQAKIDYISEITDQPSKLYDKTIRLVLV